MFGTSWGTCLATERHCRAESSHLQIDDDGTFQEIDSQAFLLVTKSLEHLLRAGDCCYIIFPNAFSKVAQPWPTKQYERRKWICTQTYLCGCPVPSAPKYDSDPCFSHSTQMYRNSLFPHFFVTEEDASRCTRSKVVRRKKKKKKSSFWTIAHFSHCTIFPAASGKVFWEWHKTSQGNYSTDHAFLERFRSILHALPLTWFWCRVLQLFSVVEARWPWRPECLKFHTCLDWFQLNTGHVNLKKRRLTASANFTIRLKLVNLLKSVVHLFARLHVPQRLNWNVAGDFLSNSSEAMTHVTQKRDWKERAGSLLDSNLAEASRAAPTDWGFEFSRNDFKMWSEIERMSYMTIEWIQWHFQLTLQGC